VLSRVVVTATQCGPVDRALHTTTTKLTIAALRYHSLQEFDELEPGADVYKLVGPVLIKQAMEEARVDVERRLEFIQGEMCVVAELKRVCCLLPITPCSLKLRCHPSPIVGVRLHVCLSACVIVRSERSEKRIKDHQDKMEATRKTIAAMGAAKESA
jgi:chaperonin cofactor prefoldin